MANTSISNNVLHFPPRRNDIKHVTLPQSMEEVNERIDDFKKYHIQEAIETIIPVLFNQIQILGFEPSIDDDHYARDAALLVESIRAFMCKLYDIPHPLQLISSSMFELDDDDGFTMSDRVKIVITQNESDD